MAEREAKGAARCTPAGDLTWKRGIDRNTVHLWPVPESPAYDLLLALPETFSAFADLVTEYPLQQGYHYALRTRLRNQSRHPLPGKPPSPIMLEEEQVAFGMIADQNDDGPPELAPNPLNDAVGGGHQTGTYDGYSDSYY